MPEKQCEAAEYYTLSERSRELEEIYELTTCRRDQDVRDELLKIYHRRMEIQLETIFNLQGQLSALGGWRERLSTRIDELEYRINKIEERFFNQVESAIDFLGRALIVGNWRGRHEHK